MAHRMECFRKAVLARDTCHERVLYITILHLAMALHAISSLSEPQHSCLSQPRLYIASFSLQVYVVQTWEFLLELEYENTPVQASIRY